MMKHLSRWYIAMSVLRPGLLFQYFASQICWPVKHNDGHIFQSSDIIHSRVMDWSLIHWLPMKQRVQCKLCTIMYAVHHGVAPSYITELKTSVAAQTSRPILRSADTTMFNLGYGWSSDNGLSPMPALPHELATGWTSTYTYFPQFQAQPQDSSFTTAFS